MPYRSEAEVVLSMWRDVERTLEALQPDSDEATRLLDEWARLRAEYQRLIEFAREHRRPEPEPWPEGRHQLVR
jgi:hypothetical protein